MKNILYKYKIKNGAYWDMSSKLKYSKTGLAIYDGAICAITDTVPANSNYLKETDTISNPHLYQIKILNSKIDAEAFIFPDHLEELPYEQWVIIDII